MDVSVISDAVATPEHDYLAFDRYLQPLLAILSSPTTETPFTIGVFGPWGSGKSTLLYMLDAALAENYPEDFVRVHFDPWLHRREEGMLIPLLQTLRDTLESDPKNRFVEAAKAVANALARLGGDIFLRKLTADAVSLEKIDRLKEAYLAQRGEVESETTNLRKRLQEQADDVKTKGARLVIFIDNLDRCDPTEIIHVLDLTKIFFDLRHTFIVLAVDKEVIDRGIEAKYNAFGFARSRASALGSEYLDKMVQLPLHLFPLRGAQVRSYVEKIGAANVVMDQLDLLQNVLLPNPRKIKRVVNIFTVVSAIADTASSLRRLDRALLVRLVVLEVQSPDLYAEVVREPSLLAALESVFQGRRRADEEADFTQAFRATAASVSALCQEYHRPETYLGSLFRESTFEAATAELPDYVTMLGS